MIKQIIFDFGGVLLEWKPEDILKRFYSSEEDRDAIRSAVFQHSDWLDLDRGVLAEHDAIRQFARRTSRQESEFQALFEEIKKSLKPIPDSISLLKDLAGRKIPLYGLSNMPMTTFEYLKIHSEIWRLFSGIVISGDVKLIKPQPEIFGYIANRYGLAPTETIFVDDHAPNIAAAGQLGFKAVLFQSASQCRNELLEALAGR